MSDNGSDSWSIVSKGEMDLSDDEEFSKISTASELQQSKRISLSKLAVNDGSRSNSPKEDTRPPKVASQEYTKISSEQQKSTFASLSAYYEVPEDKGNVTIMTPVGRYELIKLPLPKPEPEVKNDSRSESTTGGTKLTKIALEAHTKITSEQYEGKLVAVSASKTAGSRIIFNESSMGISPLIMEDHASRCRQRNQTNLSSVQRASVASRTRPSATNHGKGLAEEFASLDSQMRDETTAFEEPRSPTTYTKHPRSIEMVKIPTEIPSKLDAPVSGKMASIEDVRKNGPQPFHQKMFEPPQFINENPGYEAHAFGNIPSMSSAFSNGIPPKYGPAYVHPPPPPPSDFTSLAYGAHPPHDRPSALLGSNSNPAYRDLHSFSVLSRVDEDSQMGFPAKPTATQPRDVSKLTTDLANSRL